MNNTAYEARVRQQIEQYRHVENMHALPDIFHYWSNKYLRPKINAVLEVDSINDFYAEHLFRVARRQEGPCRFASLGAGDCWLEIEIARLLKAKGLANFRIDCLELSPVLLERAETAARAAGVSDFLHLARIFHHVVDGGDSTVVF
jgi:hypothetical protein